MYNPKTVPIPRTGRRGGWFGGWYRRMKTLAEKRLNQPDFCFDGEPKARAARTGRNIPDAWDDWQRCKQRCWKKQTRGQKAWDKR